MWFVHSIGIQRHGRALASSKIIRGPGPISCLESKGEAWKGLQSTGLWLSRI